MSDTIASEALEPLYEPWDEPTRHRVKGEKGGPAAIKDRRRPSPIDIVQNLRADVRAWRDAFYPGVSETSRVLLQHWFGRTHRKKTPSGEEFPFQYYFCQREAIETLVYLKEGGRNESLSQLIANYGGTGKEVAALGITEQEDAWTRYAFKLATGAGKTKCMSLAIVWSYFHALRETDSPMARHFVVIAPNITVYDRLRDDFQHGRVFDDDPLIPPGWRGDWNMSVVLQDESGGASTGGVLYLTNIHRLYEHNSSQSSTDEASYSFMGPAVSKAKALDTAERLQRRVTNHGRVMVLNDEAHHVWDPGSAWNTAITAIHGGLEKRGGAGLVAQLDFSATPKDARGQLFKHIVCDTPLGEAVDAGIVKTPVIGRTPDLHERAEADAGYKYDQHLRIGYARWLKSYAEWKASGFKALLFVMCESTEAADQITHRLNSDPAFEELNERTINLHTNLRGKVKAIGSGANKRYEFVPDETKTKGLTEEELKQLRQLSRELDNNESPYRCIVSVLMLREGWDVRNVTTIVPLRPYSSTSGILPEQTLGRGLRRMTPPGKTGANEMVAIVEHPRFADLYREQLADEGLFPEERDASDIEPTTITIFPDRRNKDLELLEVNIPALDAGHRRVPTLETLELEDVRKAFENYAPLPFGEEGPTEIDYEGRHLVTNEVIESMRVELPLLSTGVGAVSYYVRELERTCRINGLHSKLGPLVQAFLEQVLFEEHATLFDNRLIARLGDPDVREHVRAVFVPLIHDQTTKVFERRPMGVPRPLSEWKPFQVTHSQRRPAVEAKSTLFNLVPCHLALEAAFAAFLDGASDVAAFAKNAGPQCLRIDYLASGGRLAFYTPDFFVRLPSGKHYLVETKGQADVDVPRKARAAIAWCAAASTDALTWEYLYVGQGLFARHQGTSIEALANAARPSLVDLVDSESAEQEYPLFAGINAEQADVATEEPLVESELLASLPRPHREAVEQATMLLRFMRDKKNMNHSAAFNVLLGPLDQASRGLLLRKLQNKTPQEAAEQSEWFGLYALEARGGKRKHFEPMAENLRRTLIYERGISPIGLLRNCLDYALNDKTKLDGVFTAVKEAFRMDGGRKLLANLDQVNEFRNTRVAHQEEVLDDAALAERELKHWVRTLSTLTSS